MAVSRRALEAPAGVETTVINDYADTPAPADAILVHLAETRDSAAADTDGAHLDQTQALARQLADKPFTHRLYVSSAAVYGYADNQAHFPSETVNPMGPYAIAKRRAEEVMLSAGATVARMTNIYGPGMAGNNVISDILSQLPAAGPIRIRDGGPARDFLWIDDAARGLAAMVRHPAAGVFNLSTGQAHTVRALAELALRIAGQSDRQVVETAPRGATNRLALDPSASEAQFGWRAQTDLASGLEMLLERNP